jgi:D-beta-D-heptose 7-phosphate kinase/D-beta-D-heptose 1-phosphate adenosyltransferase
VVRTDRESRADLDPRVMDPLLERIGAAVRESEGLIISDYGKGVITARSLERTLSVARGRGVHVSVDPKESHIDVYQGVGILTPNQHEAGAVMGRRVVDEPSLLDVGWGLQRRLDSAALLITRGPEGMSLFERAGQVTHLPTVAREVYDVTGAGDTVVSVVALALAAGATYPNACFLANHAAGIVIREVGTATCSPLELIASLGEPAT